MSCPVSVDEIESLINGKDDESEEIELKQESPKQKSNSSYDNIAKTVTAFANTKGYGYIIFGICNDIENGRRPCMDYQINESEKRSVIQSVESKVEPCPHLEFIYSDPIPSEQNKHFIILVIKAYPDRKYIYRYKDSDRDIPYIRRGTGNRPMPWNELVERFKDLLGEDLRRKIKEDEDYYQGIMNKMLAYLAYCLKIGRKRNLDDLMDNVGLGIDIRKDAEEKFRSSIYITKFGEEFRFINKSFENFFAARYLHNNMSQISDIFESDYWIEPLITLVGLQEAELQKIEYIINSLLERGKDDIALQCFANSGIKISERLKYQLFDILQKKISNEMVCQPFKDINNELVKNGDIEKKIYAIKLTSINTLEDLKLLIQKLNQNNESNELVRSEVIKKLTEIAKRNQDYKQYIIDEFTKTLFDPIMEERESNKCDLLYSIRAISDKCYTTEICRRIIESKEEGILYDSAVDILDGNKQEEDYLASHDNLGNGGSK